jgi:hypothetical protein
MANLTESNTPNQDSDYEDIKRSFMAALKKKKISKSS